MKFLSIFKQFMVYAIWTLVSMIAAFGYMKIVLGPTPEMSRGWLILFDIINKVVLFKVVPIVGSIIALLFILLDVFYLKKKFQYHAWIFGIRLLVLVLITTIVGVVHYLLEKVIDII